MTKMAVNEKVNILRDFRLIKKDEKDKIAAVKKLLAPCTDYEADRLLRGVFMEAYTLDDLLVSKGVM